MGGWHEAGLRLVFLYGNSSFRQKSSVYVTFAILRWASKGTKAVPRITKQKDVHRGLKLTPMEYKKGNRRGEKLWSDLHKDPVLPSSPSTPHSSILPRCSLLIASDARGKIRGIGDAFAVNLMKIEIWNFKETETFHYTNFCSRFPPSVKKGFVKREALRFHKFTQAPS